MAVRHVAIDNWLNALNMAECAHLFRQYGGVEELIHATEADIKDIGIHNEGQRLKVVSSLRILKDKLGNGQVSGNGSGSQNRTTCGPPTAPNSPTSPSYPDFQFNLVSPEKLQADLQRELSGDPSDLRSREWYHGNITRQKAESLVTNNGDFLIRDCISQPGDFVLTCRCNDSPLNFIINSIIGYCIPGTLPTISYQFEEDTFPTIHQLIKHYLQNDKPVTVASDAILKTPVARLIPLSYYDAKYGALISFPTSSYVTPNQSPISTPFVTPFTSPQTSPSMSRRSFESSENLIKTVSNAATSKNCKNNRPTSLDNLPIINITPPGELPAPTSTKQDEPAAPSTQPIALDQKVQKSTGCWNTNNAKPVIAHIRADSAPEFISESLSTQNELFKLSNTPQKDKIPQALSENELVRPPPKPSRLPSIKQKQNPERLARKILLGDNRFSDYIQEKDDATCFHGCVESPSKFIEDILRHLSPLTSDRSERGRSPENAYRETISPPSQANEQTASDSNILSSNSQNVQNCTINQNSTAPSTYTLHSDIDQSTLSQTVARSKSFQIPRKINENCGRQYDAQIEGNKSFPSISSTCKVALSSGARILLPDQKDNKKDSSKGNVNEDSDIFRLQDVDYIKSLKLAPPTFFRTNLTPEIFTSNLFSNDHKAFDQAIVLNVKSILMTKSPMAIAMHLTKYDLKLTYSLHETDFGLGVTSGLELITLPQGKQLRQDVIERWESLRLFTLVTLLTSETVNERADILSLWVRTCLELKTTAGNLYSFAAIMAALDNPHIRRLSDMWLNLRQNHTTDAVVFDTKLRPALISLNDACSEIPLTNICVPYITPVCQLLERDLESVLHEFYWEMELDPIASAIDVLLNHLDVARDIASQSSLYRVSGKELAARMKSDPELGHILCPEFHMLLLWGPKNLRVARQDRLNKIDQIFGLLSLKRQASDDEGIS